jgi:hypothetical protein
VGSATLGAVSGGVGRGIGQFFGNRVYGDTIEQLENFTENYKFKQLINYYTRSQLSATRDLNDEFYSQTQQEISQTLNQIAQQ